MSSATIITHRLIKSKVRSLFDSVTRYFGPNFNVFNVDSKEFHTGIVGSISNDNTVIIYCMDDERLEFQDKDLVVFTEDNGTNGLNDGEPRKVNNYYDKTSWEMIEFLQGSVEIIHKNHVKILISFIQASIKEELQQEKVFYS